MKTRDPVPELDTRRIGNTKIDFVLLRDLGWVWMKSPNCCVGKDSKRMASKVSNFGWGITGQAAWKKMLQAQKEAAAIKPL
jgi:hypothetical protein